MLRRSSHRKYLRGMTLVELLTTVSIIVIVMVAVGTFQFNVIRNNRSTQVRLVNTQEAGNIVRTMSRELRAMANSANGSYAILSAGTSTITFYADIDSDGFTDQLRYYLASTTLYRGVTKPSGSPATYPASQEVRRLLATGIRNASTSPVFEYYPATYDGTTAAMTYPLVLTSIRLVKINITIDTDPNRAPVVKTFSTQAALRNLKDNL